MERTDSSAMNSLQSLYADDSDDDMPENTGSAVDNISDEETDTVSLGRQVPRSGLPQHMFEDARGTTPTSTQSNEDEKKSSASKRPTRLVSYQGEGDDDSEAEESSEEIAISPVDEDSNQQSDAKDIAPFIQRSRDGNTDDIEIPPSPPGRCSVKLQEKIRTYLEKSRRIGLDMNAQIQLRKDFRNPSIYEKLIEMCNIDEKGTNFPPDIYDPHMWSKESFYDELEKIQRKEMEKRDKEKKERTKIEFVTGTKRVVPLDSHGVPDEKKRKTKWDTQPPPGSAVMRPQIGSAGVVNNITLTTSASGTKSTIIPATGSITKKSSSR